MQQMVSIENRNRQRDFAASCRRILQIRPVQSISPDAYRRVVVRHSSDTSRPLEARGVVDRRKESNSRTFSIAIAA